jgi:hypothetical protein
MPRSPPPRPALATPTPSLARSCARPAAAVLV